MNEKFFGEVLPAESYLSCKFSYRKINKAIRKTFSPGYARLVLLLFLLSTCQLINELVLPVMRIVRFERIVAE